MRIALVIFRSDPSRGGAERYTHDLATSLLSRGHRVVILCSDAGDDSMHVRLSCQSATRAGQYKRFLASLDAHLTHNTYDIVHAMLPVPKCDVYHPHAGLAVEAVQRGHLQRASLAGKMLAGLANRINRKRQLFAQVERQMLTGTHPPVVLCLSNYVKQPIQTYYPSAKVQTLFNAVDLQKFTPDGSSDVRARLGIAAHDVMMLMIAQDYARKGLAAAIIALAKLAEPRPWLVVVGRQPPGEYAELARRLGVADRVIFAGPTTSPVDFYRAADFFVLPTHHDPCSLVVLEALAMGVPVISTVFNGACEIMTDGIHGRVLQNPGDATVLAGAMRQLSDAKVRTLMKSACLALRPALSLATHIAKLESIYQSCRQGETPSQQETPIHG